MADARAQRYEGRPLLRVLDCYVLSITGALDPEMERKVMEVVSSRMGGRLDWRASIRGRLGLPAEMDERIRRLWQAQPPGTDPVAFALAVSDDNFAPMIDQL